MRTALIFLLPPVKRKTILKTPFPPSIYGSLKAPASSHQLPGQNNAFFPPAGLLPPQQSQAHTNYYRAPSSGIAVRPGDPGDSRGIHTQTPQHGQQTQPRRGRGISPSLAGSSWICITPRSPHRPLHSLQIVHCNKKGALWWHEV